MGRAFENELSNVNDTFKFSLSRDTKIVEQFLSRISSIPLIVVGSGGSYSAAKAFELFAQSSGLSPLAKAMTPFELNSYPRLVKENACVLLTAGGNNRDTVNAFKFISELEPQEFLSICMRDKSKIHKLASEYSKIYFYEGAIPFGKDGYLAVNSLFSIVTILIKAFHEIYPNNVFYNIDSTVNFIYSRDSEIKKQNIETLMRYRTYITLYGGIATPAAFDLESKFSEAALGAVQLTDFRNFAHGRHYWLSQNASDTCIIMFISPNEEDIAKATMKVLPPEIPIIEIRTNKDNSFGVLDLLYQVFLYTQLIGEVKKTDPGRPKVKDYGRKLFHINYNFWSPHRSNPYKGISKRAVYRKCGTSELLFSKYEQSFFMFAKSITSKQFQAVIFDYDGTIKNVMDKNFDPKISSKLIEMLHNNVQLGIATGRGKSVKEELRDIIPSPYWKKVIIAYYNGGAIASLDNDAIPDVNIQADSSLQSIYNKIKSVVPNVSNIELRPKQISMIFDGCNDPSIEIRIREICAHHSNIKIWKSGHSIDIVTSDCSKLNILDYIKAPYVLTIGDSGGIEGNDYELLSTPYSLSVDKVSKSFDSCWNCSPLGINGPDATIFYLNSLMEVTNQGVTVKI